MKELKIVCFHMISFIINMVTSTFCVLADQDSKKMRSKFRVNGLGYTLKINF